MPKKKPAAKKGTKRKRPAAIKLPPEVADNLPKAPPDCRWHPVERAMGWFAEASYSDDQDAPFLQIGYIARNRWTEFRREGRHWSVLALETREQAQLICDALNANGLR